MENKRIACYKELEVYTSSYSAMLIIMKEVIPKLPEKERFDLKDQLSRSCKAIPRLIAEGYAKRHQKSGFQKYLDDAMAECNETAVSLTQARDIYSICTASPTLESLIDLYDKIGRQLYKLSVAWTKFKHRSTQPLNDTGLVTDTR